MSWSVEHIKSDSHFFPPPTLYLCRSLSLWHPTCRVLFLFFCFFLFGGPSTQFTVSFMVAVHNGNAIYSLFIVLVAALLRWLGAGRFRVRFSYFPFTLCVMILLLLLLRLSLCSCCLTSIGVETELGWWRKHHLFVQR